MLLDAIFKAKLNTISLLLKSYDARQENSISTKVQRTFCDL